MEDGKGQAHACQPLDRQRVENSAGGSREKPSPGSAAVSAARSGGAGRMPALPGSTKETMASKACLTVMGARHCTCHKS